MFFLVFMDFRIEKLCMFLFLFHCFRLVRDFKGSSLPLPPQSSPSLSLFWNISKGCLKACKGFQRLPPPSPFPWEILMEEGGCPTLRELEKKEWKMKKTSENHRKLKKTWEKWPPVFFSPLSKNHLKTKKKLRRLRKTNKKQRKPMKN